jgi:hypothetical protein
VLRRNGGRAQRSEDERSGSERWGRRVRSERDEGGRWWSVRWFGHQRGRGRERGNGGASHRLAGEI